MLWRLGARARRDRADSASCPRDQRAHLAITTGCPRRVERERERAIGLPAREVLLVVDEAQLRELAPRALLRHSLRSNPTEPLEAASLALTLVQRALGPRTTHTPGATSGRQRLADRAKLVLSGDLSRRWTLAEVAGEVGTSPVYLTQVFQQVEGVPLYRYQLRLRLARALDLMDRRDDLSALAMELGFSSHSHFSAAFHQTYGRSPSGFRRAAIRPLRRSSSGRSSG